MTTNANMENTTFTIRIKRKKTGLLAYSFNDLFVRQDQRKHVLQNMMLYKHLSGISLYNLIMNEKNTNQTDTRRGLVYETICQILIIARCMDMKLNYNEIYKDQLQNLKKIENILELLDTRVNGGGNNVSDMSLLCETTKIFISVKYSKNFCETDLTSLDSTIKTQQLTDDYKLCLIVKDKSIYENHSFRNKQNVKKIHIDNAINNGLLFDENDIIDGIDIFCRKFKDVPCNANDLTSIIDYINTECLDSPRLRLIPKLQQQMTLLKFMDSMNTNNKKMWCISHKPRSGKSITMLLICKYLLEQGLRKILIMTSVPATIDSFVKDLNTYEEFKRIQFKSQKEFETIDNDFIGIVFCSVQFLKINGKIKKKDLLIRINFDAFIIDESHYGSSNNNTKTSIIECEDIVKTIHTTNKITIFASGTSDKTRRYYNIPNAYNYMWEIEDESYMKRLTNKNKIDEDTTEIMNYMINRHGANFIRCFDDKLINKDYSTQPIQVLMKYSIPQRLIDKILEYNRFNNTNYGFSCSSLFALRQFVGKNGAVEYAEDFELCNTNYGDEIIEGFLSSILSSNRMNNTMMRQIELVQTRYSSRKSSRTNPLLFIIYLPTHTRNNTLVILQKTLKRFIETRNLWSEYNVEYSNSTDDSGDVKESYNDYIDSIMIKAKSENKIGVVLLLGCKGTTGITYNRCDATISLDDGHSLDNQKQRINRSSTEAHCKSVSINVDMNIQRTYIYLLDIIHKYRRNTKTTMTNAEIMCYLYKNNIFLFDPQEINNGDLNAIEIMSYYKRVSENIIKEIDDTPFLENLVCDDSMREYIMYDFHKPISLMKDINEDLLGEQPDCPIGGKIAYLVGSFTNIEVSNKNTEVDNSVIECVINQTYELCKSFLFPLLALISRSYRVPDFKLIFRNDETEQLIKLLLMDKIELNEISYNVIRSVMDTIIDNNLEIVSNIREIYETAPADKIRDLIAKHFIPTPDEKKKNAEIPTPVKLCDDMIDKMPPEFWTALHKVFEPCCGKGNFVLAIFDRFFRGLAESIPDETERCMAIVNECLYFADLTPLNVFVTTELLKCHVQSYCGIEEFDASWKFNSYVGDTLKMNVGEVWGVEGFDAVIGNPPYNDNSGNKGKGHTLWTKFIETAINDWLVVSGYLLFVNPALWRQIEHPLLKLMKEYQIHYLEIHNTDDGQKTFRCATRYDWYVLEKTSVYKDTIIKDEENKLWNIDLRDWEFIPNMMYDEIKKMTNGTEKINLIHSEGSYEVRRNWMSHIKTENHIYPCIYSINKSNELSLKWSKINNKGHFNLSKFIFTNGAGFYCDEAGNYGITQWGSGIVETPENLKEIENAFRNNKFKKIKEAIHLDSSSYNIKIMKLFRKDFWKEFV